MFQHITCWHSLNTDDLQHLTTCCIVNGMPKKNPIYITDQGFPNTVKGWGKENPP